MTRSYTIVIRNPHSMCIEVVSLKAGSHTKAAEAAQANVRYKDINQGLFSTDMDEYEVFAVFEGDLKPAFTKS